MDCFRIPREFLYEGRETFKHGRKVGVNSQSNARDRALYLMAASVVNYFLFLFQNYFYLRGGHYSCNSLQFTSWKMLIVGNLETSRELLEVKFVK